ncbi:MAG: hypothetical protein K6D97_03160 [Clostridia bacterium]|nr:hypothetical protein [Clostridia bacterium]
MAKILKKILIIQIVIVILSLFVLPNFTRINNAYADSNATIGIFFDNILIGGIIGIASWLIRVFILFTELGIEAIGSAFAMVGNTDGELTFTDRLFISPVIVFFDKLPIFSVDFFNLDSPSTGAVHDFRMTIATWYYAMRLIAAAILLVMLIYVGIRMAISTIAREQAVYKQMLVDWIVSMGILYLLHYFIIFVITLNQAFVQMIWKVLDNEEAASGVSDFNFALLEQALAFSGLKEQTSAFPVEKINNINNFMSMVALIVFTLLLFQTIKFMLIYTKRMITIGFLILISPLITVTYAMDKMGDGKAQALGNWLKEFCYNIFIQPFHCIIYAAFADCAFNLVSMKVIESNQIGLGTAVGNGVLAIMSLLFINQAEKFVYKLFGFGNARSLTSAAASAAMVATAYRKAPEIATNFQKQARKSVSNVRAIGRTSGKIGAQAAKLATSTRIGKSIGNTTKQVGQKVGKFAGDTVDNTSKRLIELRKKIRNNKYKKQAINELKREHPDWDEDDIMLDHAEEVDERIKRIEKDAQKPNPRIQTIASNIEAKRSQRAATREQKATERKARKEGKKALKLSKKNEFNQKHPTLSKATRKIGDAAQTTTKYIGGKAVKAINASGNWVKEGLQLESQNIRAGKYFKYPAAFIAGIGALEGSGSVLESLAATEAVYRAGDEVYKHSKVTLHERRQSDEKSVERASGISINRENRGNYYINVKRKGDSGQYNKDWISDLEKALQGEVSSQLDIDDEKSKKFVSDIGNNLALGYSIQQAIDNACTDNRLKPNDVSDDLRDQISSLYTEKSEAKLYESINMELSMGSRIEDVIADTKDRKSSKAGTSTIPRIVERTTVSNVEHTEYTRDDLQDILNDMKHRLKNMTSNPEAKAREHNMMINQIKQVARSQAGQSTDNSDIMQELNNIEQQLERDLKENK